MGCSICGKPTYLRGLCCAHYQRLRKHGNPLGGKAYQRPKGLNEAEVFRWFMPGEPPVEGCWDWVGTAGSDGYGQFSLNNRKTKAHVVSHRIFNLHDPITSEKPHVLHSCDRPICVQPGHLRAGADADNHADALARGRIPVGEARSHTKLTAADVLMIRQSSLSASRLAQTLGVSPTTVNDARSGRTWNHL